MKYAIICHVSGIVGAGKSALVNYVKHCFQSKKNFQKFSTIMFINTPDCAELSGLKTIAELLNFCGLDASLENSDSSMWLVLISLDHCDNLTVNRARFDRCRVVQ